MAQGLLTGIDRFHTAATFVSLGLIGGLGLTGAVPSTWQVLILAAGVFVVGMPHGAFDIFHLWQKGHGPAGFFLLSAAYLGLAAFVFALWLWQPGAVFAALLLVAWAHFGISERARGLERGAALMDVLLRGLIVLVFPLLLYREAIAGYFGIMALDDAAVVAAAVRAVPAFILYGAVGLWAGWSGFLLFHDRAAFLRLVIPGLGFLILPPLLAFTLYFCLWHSWPHFRDEWQEIKNDFNLSAARTIQILGLITVLSFLITAAGLFLFTTGVWGETALRLIFIGLLCLTVPHMLLGHTILSAGKEGVSENDLS